MACCIYIATAIGLYIATQTGGNWNIVRHTLTDRSLTSIVASEDIVLAGTKKGIWRSTDNGKSWATANKNLSIPHVRWMATAPNAASHLCRH